MMTHCECTVIALRVNSTLAAKAIAVLERLEHKSIVRQLLKEADEHAERLQTCVHRRRMKP